ncbi:hypothetical protein EDC56_1927 [Sinobacterium caligoides]|uniref:Uncharacterized protein n=1 Tax=Sinobacterium caligoides TaxID=933926 RepID=A0A3N2DQA2_9GAMM|nr:DUF6804 family protein [Sinobacterium caligoides]ROS01485.1 hypothetical protein EDC56_1927 [Sinobacterium caligoides]
MARIILISLLLLLLVMACFEGYYESLLVARLLVIAGFVWAAVAAKHNGYSEMYWAFLAVALLFVPAVSEQFYALSRSFIDIFALVLLVVSHHKICKRKIVVLRRCLDT